MKPGDPSKAAKANLQEQVTPRELRTFRSAELFRQDKEIVIEHAGERYRLRITRAGKLILYK